MKLARVVRAVPTDSADAFHVEQRRREIERVPGAIVLRKSRFYAVVILIALIVATGFYYVANTHLAASTATFNVEAVQGKVALTGAELRQVVLQEGITAYWVGPEPGSKYALSVLTDGQVFVRYLPDGKGLGDKKASFKVVATYVTANAFAKTQEAATAAGSVGFVDGDGNAIYYARTRPTNVYIGLKGVDLQLEVFDPLAGKALLAAKSSGMVRKVV